MLLWSLTIVALVTSRAFAQNCEDQASCSTLDQVDSVETYSGRCDLALEWRACLDSYQIAGCNVDYPQDLDTLQATYCSYTGDDDAIPVNCEDQASCSTSDQVSDVGTYSEGCALAEEWRACLDSYLTAGCNVDYPQDLGTLQATYCSYTGDDDAIPASTSTCDVANCDKTAEIETLGLWSERCALVDEWRQCVETINAACGTEEYPVDLASAESENCYGHEGNDVVDGTNPPATDPPATDPPATDPPATDPPATDPPATDPPATDPAATDPPATEPAETDPPATEPAETDPPATEPAETDPPATEPSETDPSATEPAVTDPPATDPLATEPAETDPPTTEAATTVEIYSEECQSELDECEAINQAYIDSDGDNSCTWALMWQSCDKLSAGPVCPDSILDEAQARVDYYCGERVY